ncbi:MAG: hypothetical protein AAF488_14285, partial [Planctomycetota bacterium]
MLLAAILAALVLIPFAVKFGARTPESAPSRSDLLNPKTSQVSTEIGGKHAARGEGVRGSDGSAELSLLRAGSDLRSEETTVPAIKPSLGGEHVLRVLIEGVDVADVGEVTVTAAALRTQYDDPANLRGTWEWRSSAGGPFYGDFDLTAILTEAANRSDLRQDELEIWIDHPLYILGVARVVLASGQRLEGGQTVYEVRVSSVRPEYWPEFTLAVRDAETGAHLWNVELRCMPASFMNSGWQQPGTGDHTTLLGDGLASPVTLLGGSNPQEPENWVSGLALPSLSGGEPEFFELTSVGRVTPERGVVVYARAPGYAWGRIGIDVSSGKERELLLQPAGAVRVRFSNVQLDRYAELDTIATLGIQRTEPTAGHSYVWFQTLDSTNESTGLWIEGMEPGEFEISVELGGVYSRNQRPLLARERVTLVAGDTCEVVLALEDPPAPAPRVTLSGI